MAKRWGDPILSRKCDQQARIATLLSCLLGTLGVDQFYAHHWVCGTFKSLVFILSLVFHALGQAEDSLWKSGVARILGLAIIVWSAADLFLWIVGGHYGTPGCPAGNPAWQH